jgi:hypothetical protein
MDADGDRALGQQRRYHMPRGKDGDHPPGADTPLEDRRHRPEDQCRDEVIHDPIDPQRAADQGEDWMDGEVSHVRARQLKNGVMVSGVEQAEHNGREAEQR